MLLAPPLPHNIHRPGLADALALPAWLISAVVHAVGLLLLGLLSAALVGGRSGEESPRASLVMNIDDGGATGDSAAEALAQIDSLSEFLSTPLDDSPQQRDEVATRLEQLLQPPAIDLPTLPQATVAERLAAMKREAAASAAAASQPAAKAAGFAKFPDSMGGYARTKIFGVESEGNKFVYVLDRSSSMLDGGGGRIAAAKAELLASLRDLGEQQQFYVVAYNHEARLLNIGYSPGRHVWAGPENKQRAADIIGVLRPDGGTDHVEAMAMAIRLRPDVIYLITDGEVEDDPKLSDLKRLERMNSGRSIIHVLRFGTAPRDGGTLAQLAAENRGQDRFIDLARMAEIARDRSEKPGSLVPEE